MGKNNLEAMLQGSYHMEFLKSLNMQEDIDFCLREDTADIVPEFTDSMITMEK
jgi:phosphosulfolactate phosphohydrolase-like enzyme